MTAVADTIKDRPEIVKCTTDVNGQGCGNLFKANAMVIVTTWRPNTKVREGVWVCPLCKHRNVVELAPG